jgi:hypothetical protein
MRLTKLCGTRVPLGLMEDLVKIRVCSATIQSTPVIV